MAACSYPKACEMVPDNQLGDGGTVYLLSMCDANSPWKLSMPDDESVPLDGVLTDNFPVSVAPATPVP